MNYTEKEINLIVADSIEGFSDKEKKLLLAANNPLLENAGKYADELIKTYGAGVYNNVKAEFTDGNYRAKVLDGLKKQGIECSTYKSADYPPQLKNTPAPPLVLYLRGRRELLSTRMFAVVGSRRTPAAVIEECKRFCAELSEYVTVVTGVADGGDSAAALGALSTGNVICVLPCGFGADINLNANLFKRVETEGLVISGFPPKTPVQSYTFRLRNGIIAGLSEGALVVSAGEKSGALSTAEYANNYSKELFAFPYGVGVSAGVGCNRLIKLGALLCDCVEDVLSALKIEYKKASAETFEAEDGDEAKVLNLLKNEGETHAEKIAAALNMKLTDVVTVCSMLEIKGLITRSGSNSYEAI